MFEAPRRHTMNHTRRDFRRIALAAVPIASVFAAKVNSKFGGVQIGAITYSFRGTNDLDAIVKMLVDSGVGEVELRETDAERAAGAPQVARGGGRPGGGKGPGGPPKEGAKGDGAPKGPPQRNPRPPMTEEQITAARERAKPVRDWRLAVSMDKFKEVKKKFDDAGLDIRLVCFNMTEAITDDEIDYAFNMAKALGAKALSSTTQVTVSKRVARSEEHTSELQSRFGISYAVF